MAVLEYRYRRHFRNLQVILPILLAVTIVILWGWIAFYSVIGHAPPEVVTQYVVTGMIITIVLGLEAMLVWISLRRFAKVCVEFDGETIVYHNIRGEQRIAVGDIAKLEFPSLPYLGGWVKIMVPGGETIRLTVVLEGIGRFIKSLKEALDIKERSGVYQDERIFGFYKTAEFSDQSWDRLHSIFGYLSMWVLFNLGFGLFLCRFFNLDPGRGALLGFISLFGPFLTYGVGDLLIARQIAKGTDPIEFSCPERDMEFEKRVYWRAGMIYTIVFLTAALTVIFWG